MEKYDFGNRLYEYRTQKGLTQKELGKLLGVTDKAVSKWETGESKPRLDKMNQITELFETSIDGMLGKETADGEQLKPYKTIFDLRLKKYGKYYKFSRIATYILSIICVLVSVLSVFYDIVNQGLVFERISEIISCVALSGTAVILTLIFKSKFYENSEKSVSKFSVITALLFFIPNILTALLYIKVGKASQEYDTFSLTVLAICCLAVIITLLIYAVKKKGYNAFISALVLSSILEITFIESYSFLPFIVIYPLLLQLYIHNETTSWLTLAEKAEPEIRQHFVGKKSTKILIAVAASVVVICTVLSVFSPYFFYKIMLHRFYPEGDRTETAKYDYSAEFNEGEYYEYTLKGAKFKIPNGYELTDGSNLEDGIVFFRDKNKSTINVTYYDSDELSDSELEDKEMQYMNYMYKKYFGVSFLSMYGMEYYDYAINLDDVKFYETKKAALLLMPMVSQAILSQFHVAERSAVYNNGEYCGFVSSTSFIADGKPSDFKVRTAHIWHTYDLEGTFYEISYMGRKKDRTEEDLDKIICKLVNSLEF